MIVVGEPVCAWVAEKIECGYHPGYAQGIGIEKDGEIVCGATFDSHNGKSIQIHVALKPGARMTREWLFVVFDYAFRQLAVNKIIGVVDSTNTAALRFDRHVGFVEEHVIKDAGKYGDMHIFTMTRPQCRFLKD